MLWNLGKLVDRSKMADTSTCLEQSNVASTYIYLWKPTIKFCTGRTTTVAHWSSMSHCAFTVTHITPQCSTWRSISHLSVLLNTIYHRSLSATFHYSFPYVQGQNNLTKHPALNWRQTGLNPYALAHVRQHWLLQSPQLET